MDDFTIQVFQSEIETQCKFVLLAASDLDSLLNTPPHQDFQARTHDADLVRSANDPRFGREHLQAALGQQG